MKSRALKSVQTGTILHITLESAAIAAFCYKWHIRELSLFGSVLRGDFRPESDIDIPVKLQPGHGLDLFDWGDMREEHKQVFRRDVDLMSKGRLTNPVRRKTILASEQVVYAA